jgi:hypothetical protein
LQAFTLAGLIKQVGIIASESGQSQALIRWIKAQQKHYRRLAEAMYKVRERRIFITDVKGGEHCFFKSTLSRNCMEGMAGKVLPNDGRILFFRSL